MDSKVKICELMSKFVSIDKAGIWSDDLLDIKLPFLQTLDLEF